LASSPAPTSELNLELNRIPILKNYFVYFPYVPMASRTQEKMHNLLCRMKCSRCFQAQLGWQMDWKRWAHTNANNQMELQRMWGMEKRRKQLDLINP